MKYLCVCWLGSSDPSYLHNRPIFHSLSLPPLLATFWDPQPTPFPACREFPKKGPTEKWAGKRGGAKCLAFFKKKTVYKSYRNKKLSIFLQWNCKKCLNLAWFKEQQFCVAQKPAVAQKRGAQKTASSYFSSSSPVHRMAKKGGSEVSHKKVGTGEALDLFLGGWGEKAE